MRHLHMNPAVSYKRSIEWLVSRSERSYQLGESGIIALVDGSYSKYLLTPEGWIQLDSVASIGTFPASKIRTLDLVRQLESRVALPESLILRRYLSNKHGTFGMMGGFFTVERPWMDNQPRVSCIPEGLYELKRGFFNKGGYPAYELLDVPGRSLIKIHMANLPSDVVGCIGVGEYTGYLDGKLAVMNSSRAHGKLMKETYKYIQVRNA